VWRKTTHPPSPTQPSGSARAKRLSKASTRPYAFGQWRSSFWNTLSGTFSRIVEVHIH